MMMINDQDVFLSEPLVHHDHAQDVGDDDGDHDDHDQDDNGDDGDT